jgi:hypothetical protein
MPSVVLVLVAGVWQVVLVVLLLIVWGMVFKPGLLTNPALDRGVIHKSGHHVVARPCDDGFVG